MFINELGRDDEISSRPKSFVLTTKAGHPPNALLKAHSILCANEFLYPKS